MPHGLVDVWRIDESHRTPVLLFTERYNDGDYHDKLVKSLDGLGTSFTWEQVYSSDAWKFFAANTSWLSDDETLAVTDQIAGLDAVLFRTGLYLEPTKDKGSVNPVDLVKNLRKALEAVKKDFDTKPNGLSHKLYQNVRFNIIDGNFRV